MRKNVFNVANNLEPLQRCPKRKLWVLNLGNDEGGHGERLVEQGSNDDQQGLASTFQP
jgi:hypothetical protein